jgi:hypothetical protein
VCTACVQQRSTTRIRVLISEPYQVLGCTALVRPPSSQVAKISSSWYDRCMPPSTLCTRAKCIAREYLILYRGPGFLSVVWFGSPPPQPLPIVLLSQTFCVSPVEHTDEGGWGRSQIKRRWVSPVFHNTFNNLVTVQCSESRPFQAKANGWPFLFLLKKTFSKN